MRKAIASPAQKRMQDDFSIASRLKTCAAGFKFQSQLMVIEDFAVKDYDHVAIGTDQRLVAALQVNDAQASCSKRDQLRLKAAMMVRPAVIEPAKSRLHHAARQTSADVCIPEDATHEGVSFLRAEEGENLSAPTDTLL